MLKSHTGSYHRHHICCRQSAGQISGLETTALAVHGNTTSEPRRQSLHHDLQPSEAEAPRLQQQRQIHTNTNIITINIIIAIHNDLHLCT